MKTLILGAKGMLGCELMEAFKDFELYGWDKEEIDIASQTQVNLKISKLKPSIIINAAAYTDVDGCEANKELAMRINGQAVGYLASVCKKIGAVFIHYSTDYVFSGDNPDGYKEADIPQNPLNIYGQSKLLAEILLKKNVERYYLLRTSWLFGRFGKNFVETMLKLAKNQNELKIVSDQRGKPTYAFDLAQRTREIISRRLPYGIYHVTNEEATTWYDFAKKIFEIKNLKIRLGPCSSQEFSRPAKRPQCSILLNTKLSPLRSWQKALNEYLIFDSLS